jgi:hypothetical protein
MPFACPADPCIGALNFARIDPTMSCRHIRHMRDVGISRFPFIITCSREIVYLPTSQSFYTDSLASISSRLDPGC